VLSTFSDTKRDKILNLKFNRFDTMGRAKNYKKFRYTVQNSIHKVDERIINIKNKNLKQFILNNRGEFNWDNDLELPLGRNCKLIGVYNGRVNRNYFHKEFIVDYDVRRCLKNASEEFEQLDENNEIRVMPGGWKFANQNLIDMATPNSSKYSYDQMIGGIKSR
jgi:hypothetical protein